MLNNKREEKFRYWQELVSKFESRSISSTEFCKLHNVSKGGIYKWRKYFLEKTKHVLNILVLFHWR